MQSTSKKMLMFAPVAIAGLALFTFSAARSSGGCGTG